MALTHLVDLFFQNNALMLLATFSAELLRDPEEVVFVQEQKKMSFRAQGGYQSQKIMCNNIFISNSYFWIKIKILLMNLLEWIILLMNLLLPALDKTIPGSPAVFLSLVRSPSWYWWLSLLWLQIWLWWSSFSGWCWLYWCPCGDGAIESERGHVYLHLSVFLCWHSVF